jgi:small subunit ribosomal protein S16
MSEEDSMATTIRLTRMGRKQAPFYRVVVTDSRARRDGAYIESLGFYNPMPDAFQLDVDHSRALHWLQHGAEMSDTARSLLRKEGVLLRWHLTRQGVAESEIEQKVEDFRSRRAQQSDAIKAESKAKFEAWQKSKEDSAKKKVAAAQQATKDAEAEAKAESEADAAAEESTSSADVAPAEGEAAESDAAEAKDES